MPDRRVKLYKYTKREFAEGMIANGVFRIGTLSDFRRVEHGPAIGDASEGTTKLTHSVESAAWEEIKDSPAVRSLITGELGPGGVFQNVGFSAPFQSPEAYIFCVSEHSSREVMESFGSDACLRIVDDQKFFAALHGCLKDRGLVTSNYLVQRCVYRNRTQRWEKYERTHPALLKSPDYQSQAEVRGIFEPAKLPISPEFITCPEAAEYLVWHDVDAVGPGVDYDEHDPAVVHDRVFDGGERVDVDDRSFFDCTFGNCRLTYSGGGPTQMTRCTLDLAKAQFVVDAAAGRALKFLAAIYAAPNGAKLVEAVFDQVRAGYFPEHKAPAAKKKIRQYRSARFEHGERVQLDGNDFRGCAFIRCTLVYRAEVSTTLIGCTFAASGVELAFEGAARRTLEMLWGFVRDLGEVGVRLVEATFRSIRTGELPWERT